MSDRGEWVLAETFAEVADISPQAARRALRRANEGRLSRGHELVVRHRADRGYGSLELKLSSLPGGSQPAASGEIKSHAHASDIRSTSGPGVLDHRWRAVRDPLAHPRRSPQRAAAVCAAADRTGHSPRTLYRWLDRYETYGVAGLARARSATVGPPPATVSRAFDRACRAAVHDETVVKDIAETVHKALKGLWASRAEQAGGREIRRLADCAAHAALNAEIDLDGNDLRAAGPPAFAPNIQSTLYF